MKNAILAAATVLTGAGCATIETTNNSQAAWRVQSDTVEMFVTVSGGHMAPVHFYRDSKSPVQPYYISPWQNDKLKDLPDPVLVPLRGDFFCMPFGGNAEPFKGEKYTGHGEVSSSKWSFVRLEKKDGITTLTLQMKTKIRKGKVTKKLTLVDGHNAVYSTHTIEGFTGKMPLGHHCTLDVPEKEGSLRVAVSKFAFGMTNPVIFSNPKNREYQSLAINARFTDLTKVPVIAKDDPPADCSSFPQREGYTDLIQIFKKGSKTPAWTAVTCQDRGYLWYSLKDAAVLPGTVFWISNKGRHGSPWDGRNRCLGMEEVSGYFAEGLVPSVKGNMISKAGFPTYVTFSPTRPTTVKLIQGVVKVPKGFANVKEVRFAPGKVTFVSTKGKSVTADIRHEFLNSEPF